MSNKTVFILRGVPGAGKSRLARKLRKGRKNCEVISADHYFTPFGLGTGQYRFDPAKLGEAHSWCLRSFLEYLQWERRTVIVDNTNTTAVEIAPYAALALAYGYKVQVITIAANAREAARRNVHGVPVETVLRMTKRLKEETPRLPPWWPHKIIRTTGKV